MNKAMDRIGGCIFCGVVSLIVMAIVTGIGYLFTKSWNWQLFGVGAVVVFVVILLIDHYYMGDEEEDEDEGY